MTTKIFWILLILTVVAKVEQPLFVSLATVFTRSTYQVTFFLDFVPFVNRFNNVQNYIKDFKKDIHDPDYFSLIMHKSTNPCVSPLLDEQDLAAFMQSAYCLSAPYVCMTRLKIDRVLMEVNYLEDLFEIVY